MQYEGPHFDQCYQSIWMSAGCMQDGVDSPEIMTLGKMTDLNNMNLRYLLFICPISLLKNQAKLMCNNFYCIYKVSCSIQQLNLILHAFCNCSPCSTR